MPRDVFQEQLYNSINRAFYHGSKTDRMDKTFAKYGCLYITLDPLYAIGYAKNVPTATFGKVYKIRILRKLNIFNPKAGNDRIRIMDFLSDIGDFDVKRNIYKNIQENDWSFLFNGDKGRDEIINVLQGIGKYDGWFNYEYDDIMLEEGNDFFGRVKVPCIGLFNTDCISIEEIDFRELNEFKKEHERDLKILTRDATIAYHKGVDIFSYLFANLITPSSPKYLTFTIDELKEWYSKFNPNEETTDKLLEEAKKNNGDTGLVCHGRRLIYW